MLWHNRELRTQKSTAGTCVCVCMHIKGENHAILWGSETIFESHIPSTWCTQHGSAHMHSDQQSTYKISEKNVCIKARLPDTPQISAVIYKDTYIGIYTHKIYKHTYSCTRTRQIKHTRIPGPVFLRQDLRLPCPCSSSYHLPVQQRSTYQQVV